MEWGVEPRRPTPMSTKGECMKKTTKHRLTVRQVHTLGPGKYADGGGLYLIVEGQGARRWLFRYTAGGKRREQGFGSTSKVSLARARELAADAAALLGSGIDPLAQRAEQRAAEKARQAGSQTFGRFADAWFENSVASGLRNEKHVAQWKLSLSDAFCRLIRNKPIALISTEDVLAVLKPVWTTRPETAARLLALAAAGYTGGVMGVQHMNLQIARLVAAACSDGRLAPLRFLALIAIVLALTGRASAQPPAAWLAEWSRMDFSRAPVSLLEISGGGPGRDGIPAIRRRGG